MARMKHESGAHFVCQCFREYKGWKVFVHDTYRWERKVQFLSSTLIKALKMCIVKELLGYFFLNLDKQRIHGRLFWLQRFSLNFYQTQHPYLWDSQLGFPSCKMFIHLNIRNIQVKCWAVTRSSQKFQAFKFVLICKPWHYWEFLRIPSLHGALIFYSQKFPRMPRLTTQSLFA